MQAPKQAKDIMQATSEVIHVDANLLDAAVRLRRDKLPALPVVDGDEVVGILTEAAIAEKTRSAQNDLAAAAARDLMSAKVGFCRSHESVATAKAAMREAGCTHLLVTGGDGKLCGVLSAERLADVSEEASSQPAQNEDRPASSHVVETGGRAKGGKPHHPKNYSVTPKLRD